MSFNWKKIAIFGAAFGAAAGLALSAIGGLVLWLESRPSGMDNSSVKAVTSRASQTFNLSQDQKAMIPTGFELYFVLSNTTRRDYTIPEDAKLFGRDAQTGALSELKGTLDHAFIPAKDKAEVGLVIEASCGDRDMETGVTTQRDSQTCYRDAVGSDSGFLILDYSNHLRIELPRPTLIPTPSNPPVQTTEVPPDKGDIFDRVAGCQRAERLINVCRAGHIKARKDEFSDLGGFPTPLPTLPASSSSSEQGADPTVCGTAYAWRNFCRAAQVSPAQR